MRQVWPNRSPPVRIGLTLKLGVTKDVWNWKCTMKSCLQLNILYSHAHAEKMPLVSYPCSIFWLNPKLTPKIRGYKKCLKLKMHHKIVSEVNDPSFPCSCEKNETGFVSLLEILIKSHFLPILGRPTGHLHHLRNLRPAIPVFPNYLLQLRHIKPSLLEFMIKRLSALGL